MGLIVNPLACELLLAQIERRVAEPVSPKVRDELLSELDQTSDALHHLQEDAAYVNTFAQKHFEEMEERISNLHGRIHDQTIRFVVTLVQKGAAFLEATGDLQLRAEIVDLLKDHIHFLFQNYRPSLADKQLIFLALGMDLDQWAYLETEAVLEDLVNNYQNKKAIRPDFDRLSAKQKELFYAYLEPEEAAFNLLHEEGHPVDIRS
jgi:DUF1680 family protein